MANLHHHSPGQRLAAAIACTLCLMLATASAQTYRVIHDFTGGQDGAVPTSGVTIDRAGNLYGTAEMGGFDSWGTVYKMVHSGSGWVFSPLFIFTDGIEGARPWDRPIIGPNGSLYVTTSVGSGGNCYSGCGAVVNLRPPTQFCRSVTCLWTASVIYTFQGNFDGGRPLGEVVFDAAGNLYGTTALGGGNGCLDPGCGTVYKIAPAGGGWQESVLYAFSGGSDGEGPASGLALDSAGNLYGTATDAGAYNAGTAFEVAHSGSGWTEQTLYSFQQQTNGSDPYGGLIFDNAGNLYGANAFHGPGGGGTVYQLTPSNGNWNFNLVFGFSSGSGGGGSTATLTMDSAGNLYGTTFADGQYGEGTVFKLTPGSYGWTYTSLHDFTGGSDGGRPYSSVSISNDGKLYGTTSLGGAHTSGVVWEITP